METRSFLEAPHSIALILSWNVKQNFFFFGLYVVWTMVKCRWRKTGQLIQSGISINMTSCDVDGVSGSVNSLMSWLQVWAAVWGVKLRVFVRDESRWDVTDGLRRHVHKTWHWLHCTGQCYSCCPCHWQVQEGWPSAWSFNAPGITTARIRIVSTESLWFEHLGFETLTYNVIAFVSVICRCLIVRQKKVNKK